LDPPLPHEQVRFAHNSERQFARLLDFYGIEWQYEPRTFTLERDKAGNPVQAFTPDFYLPAYDLYIEITTLNQKLVTKKNRKARRLTELYPEVKIRVFYQRDYLSLLMKYGLEPPSQLVTDGDAPPFWLAEPPGSASGAAAAAAKAAARSAEDDSAEPPSKRRPKSA
jgi:hypoxanthine phosphoribosyltransferase